MNATPPNRWKTPWRGPRRIFAWFVLLGLAAFVVVFCLSLIWGPGDSLGEHVALAAVAALGLAVVGFLATVGVRWLCCWRRFRWVLFGGVCLITLFALAHAVENWRGHHAWKKFQQKAAAQGERFDLASIIPPAVPDADNFAMAPIFEGVRNEMDPEWRRAHTGPSGLTHEHRLKLSPYRTNGGSADVSLGGWQKAERTDLRAWQTYYRTPKKSSDNGGLFTEGLDPEAQAAFLERYGFGSASSTNRPPDTNALVYEFPIAPQPQSHAADVLLALSKFDPVVEELREASRRPHSQFPLRYEDTFEMLLPHLSKLRGCNQLLALRALAELNAGQPERALADVKLSLRLADSVRTEPILISHLVRIALIHIALQPVWEGLADHRWTDAQLVALDAELTKLDFLEDYQTGMRGERVCSIAAVDYVQRRRDLGLIDFVADSSESITTPLQTKLLLRLVPRGWFDQNRATMGRMHLELFKPAVNPQERKVSPGDLRQLNEALKQHVSRRTPYNFFSGLLLPALSKAAEKFARAQACVDLARVACALERHRLAHGQYPPTLDALVPQYIARLPHDVINSQPLQYRRTDDGQFLLYSVGWNESDDGGETALTKSGNADWNAGDWVWRYPAE